MSEHIPLLILILILDYKPELGTFKWDILNPDRLINHGGGENALFDLWRLRKRGN